MAQPIAPIQILDLPAIVRVTRMNVTLNTTGSHLGGSLLPVVIDETGQRWTVPVAHQPGALAWTRVALAEGNANDLGPTEFALDAAGQLRITVL